MGLSAFNDPLLWGVTGWQLILAFVLLMLGFFARRFVRSVLSGWVRRRAERTKVAWDEDLADSLARPLGLIVQVGIWFLVANVLALPAEEVNVRQIVFGGLQIALAVGVVWGAFVLIDVLARASQAVVERTDTLLDDQLVPLLRKALKTFVAILIAVAVVQNLGIDVWSLIASLGIGGLVLALAAKDTVSNFFGSLIVFTDQPFQIGNIIEVEGVEGVVEEVGFRTTRIRQFDKSLVIMPNQKFTTTPIINHSLRARRRIKFNVGLSYDTSPDQMETFVSRLRGLLAGHDGLDHSYHAVYFNGYEDSSLNVLVVCFANTTDWDLYSTTQQAVLLATLRLVAELGLDVAFPTRTVHVSGMTP
ncbi:MAG: mechanosensitive ion channel family protein [Bacteroidota bacterium]